MQVSFTKQTLSNGLDVIVHEDHHAPIVAVSVWYHVGSKNERPGLTGLAHLFEHLMFEGSAHQPSGYFVPLQQAGATVNGSTSADRTNYYEVVPKDAAELALWMEADRMGWLLPALTDSRFETQRDVVLNERRQNYENRPYGLAHFALLEAVYPRNHSYHWPTIGDPDDLRAATADDAHAFFREFYHPGNASLAIAGDIDTSDALSLAERLFGEIPGGEPIADVHPPALDSRSRRLILEDRVELPRLYLTWPTPRLFSERDAVFDLLADLLAAGRMSRLYARLVYERRIATDVGAVQGSRELGSLFQIIATAAPGHALSELESAIHEELSHVASAGPTDDELERGRVQAEASFVYRLQTLGGFGGKADQLNAYNVYLGRPDYFADDLQRYLSVSAGEIAAAAAELTPSTVTALSVVPAGQTELALGGSDRALT